MSEIIFLNPSHLLACSTLYADVFSRSPWGEFWTIESAQRRLTQVFQTPGFLGIGYFKNNDLQGFVIGCCEDWLETQIFYLKEMCVKPTLQGKGIGKSLLESLKDHLRTLNIPKIYLLTMMNGHAQHFYLKHNFTNSDKLTVMGCLL